MQDGTTTAAAHDLRRALSIGRYACIAALVAATTVLAQSPAAVEPGESPNAAAGAQPSGGPPLDVGGVRIGMPLAQAVERLRKETPNLIVEPLRVTFKVDPQRPCTYGVKLRTPPSSGITTQWLLGGACPPNPPVINSIIRYVSYAPGTQPTVANTRAAAIEKYGQSHLQRANMPEALLFSASNYGNGLPPQQCVQWMTHGGLDGQILQEFVWLQQGGAILADVAKSCPAFVSVTMQGSATGQISGLANIVQDLPGALQLARRSQAYLAQLERGAARSSEQAADQRGKPGM